MRKTWISILLALIILITACSQQPTPAATSIPTAAPTEQAPVAGEAAQPTAGIIPTSAPASCTLSSMLPKVNSELAAAIPQVSDRDWVIGPKDAKITFMEFSDFQ
ncbi:MAG: hypothetical protein WCG34_01625 [Leptolinea sp.]